MSHWIVLFVTLFVLCLESSCTALDKNENESLEKLHEHRMEGTLEHLLNNDEPSVRSDERRPRELLERDEHSEVKDPLQGLLKAVKGIQGEYDLLDKALSKQRIAVEEMEQKLLAVQNDIKEIQGNVLEVTGSLARLITEVHAVENDTKKLDSVVSNSNILVQLVLNKERDQTKQISTLESVTNELKAAVSLESLNKTVQNLLPAAVNSSTYDLRQQVSELKSALDNTKTKNIMDDLQLALQQISELRGKCVSNDELDQRLQNVTNVREVSNNTGIINKCSVNLHHDPRDGRTHLRLAMDPPNTESFN